jgi:hypothetical protein
MSDDSVSRATERPPGWLGASVSRSRIVVALLVTLLISRLPEIVLREVLGLSVPWMPWAIVGVTIVLWLASRFVDVLRPLERYLAVMIVVGIAVASLEVILGSDPWAELVPPTTQPMIALLATRTLLLVAAGIVVAVTLALGATRQEAYLAVGDLDASTRTRRQDGSYVGWKRFGPLAVVGLMLLMVWFTAPILPDRIDIVAALPYIAIGAVAALFNAFWEEAAFVRRRCRCSSARWVRRPGSSSSPPGSGSATTTVASRQAWSEPSHPGRLPCSSGAR